MIPALNRATERKAKIRGGDAVGELVTGLCPSADIVIVGAESVLVCMAIVDEGHVPRAQGERHLCTYLVTTAYVITEVPCELEHK